MSTALRASLAQVYNEMHGLFVQVGKHYCLKRGPRCEICPLGPLLGLGPEHGESRVLSNADALDDHPTDLLPRRRRKRRLLALFGRLLQPGEARIGADFAQHGVELEL